MLGTAPSTPVLRRRLSVLMVGASHLRGGVIMITTAVITVMNMTVSTRPAAMVSSPAVTSAASTHQPYVPLSISGYFS